MQRPRKDRFEVNPYNGEELQQLFELVKGTVFELPVILAAFYGLRRSEVCGLKWDSIDFERKVFTVRHVVTQTCLNGKSTIIAKDRPKTKSSLRSLPIVQPFEEALYSLQDMRDTGEIRIGRMTGRNSRQSIRMQDPRDLFIRFILKSTVSRANNLRLPGTSSGSLKGYVHGRTNRSMCNHKVTQPPIARRLRQFEENLFYMFSVVSIGSPLRVR